jgi:hypothetical protein
MATQTKNDMVSGELTERDLKELIAAVKLIRSKLPFLITLSAAQKRSLARAGDETIEACMDIAAVAEAEPGEFPERICDPRKMYADKKLHDQVAQVARELEGLTSDVGDLLLALRSDILRHALSGYTLIQRMADQRPDLLKSIDKLSDLLNTRPKR